MEWIVPFVVLLPFVLVVLVAGSGRRAAADHQSRRLAEIERKLDLVIDHLGIVEPETGAPAAVMQELLAGRKLQAIKVYRAATGAGLREAKDAVEAMQRQRGLS
ncbi:ribosomal protein L7/L12 [Dactylosporangium sp. NPDC049525]|uniref:ribosomal protein L7/L12 n=1 Tax=Dactylosporangium sp. NPDC049525 TaxID=3154730 RepID=UPI00343B9845